MKNLLLIMLVVALATSCRFSTTSDEKQNQATQIGNVRDGMFIHVSSNDPNRVNMALSMAGMMSEDHDVIMYFDIKGIDAIVKNATDFTSGEFSSSHTKLRELIEKGIVIQACPGCLESAGYTTNDLIEGIILADKEKFFNFTKGRILTLDY